MASKLLPLLVKLVLAKPNTAIELARDLSLLEDLGQDLRVILLVDGPRNTERFETDCFVFNLVEPLGSERLTP